MCMKCKESITTCIRMVKTRWIFAILCLQAVCLLFILNKFILSKSNLLSAYHETKRADYLGQVNNHHILQAYLDKNNKLIYHEKNNILLIHHEKNKVIHHEKNKLIHHEKNKLIHHEKNKLIHHEKNKLIYHENSNLMNYGGPIDCHKLIYGDASQMALAQLWQERNPKVKIPDGAYINLTANCEQFKSSREYINYVPKEEADLSMAFSIVMHRDTEQVERLLRLIYRPHHFYCIHVDLKSPDEIYKSMKAITECFPNVFMASERFDVRWSRYSNLQPDIICMKDLLKYKGWSYFHNLAGTEFPLRTMGEMTKIIQALNGSNDVGGNPNGQDPNKFRLAWRVNITTKISFPNGTVQKKFKPPPPHGLELAKGSLHVLVRREFVDYTINNPVAVDFLDWVSGTYHPDETFFATLNYNPQLRIPGSFSFPLSEYRHREQINRFVLWGGVPMGCHGKTERAVCIFGVGDLPTLRERPELFLNKFLLDFEPIAMDCMEEYIMNKTIAEFTKGVNINRTLYENLLAVRYHF